MTAAFYGGCAKNVTPHPNQLNAFDGQVYDRLTEAQAALDEAKAQFAAGKLPPTAKTVINGAGATYEQTRTAWVLWRDVSMGVKQGDQDSLHTQLLADMNQLAQAIINVKALFGGK
jgi:hypothetical protein